MSARAPHLLLAVTLALSGGNRFRGQADPPKDFRQVAWGMTKAQVVASESKSPAEIAESKGEMIVRYDSVRFAGLDARVVYLFARDQLVRAKYILDANHAELNDFIGDFKTVEPVLVEQYGKPAEERAIWLDDSTQLEPKSYLDQDRATPANILPSDQLVGLAVSLGHLKLYTEWHGNRTEVRHLLTGENHQIVHLVEYRSVALAPREGEVRGRQVFEDAPGGRRGR
jgi:hypothetical protein